MKKSTQYTILGTIEIISSLVLPIIILSIWALLKEPKVSIEQRWMDGWRTVQVTTTHPLAAIMPYLAVFAFIASLAIGFFCFYEAHKAEESEKAPSSCRYCGAALPEQGDYCITCGRKIMSG